MPEDRRALGRVAPQDWTAAYTRKGLRALFFRPRGRWPIVDIHHGGMQMAVKEKLERGAALVLELHCGGEEVLRVDGEVAWVGPAPEGSECAYSVGVRFTAHHGESWRRLQELANQTSPND